MLKVTLVKELSVFQRLVLAAAAVVRARGYTSRTVSDDDVIKAVNSAPSCAKLRDAMGWKWSYPVEEQARFCNVVRQNLAFKEGRMFTFGDVLHIEDQRCAHGQQFFCIECRNLGTKPPGAKRGKGKN